MHKAALFSAPVPPVVHLEPDPHAWAMHVAARALASDLAGQFNVGVDETWATLCRVPDNVLGLLESPEGWNALAGFVASNLGQTAPNYQPCRH